MQALREYDTLRSATAPQPKDPAFFISRTNRRLIYAVVSPAFRQLVTAAGVGIDAPHPPRLRDLRHSFAIQTLLHWYRTEDNVQAKIRRCRPVWDIANRPTPTGICPRRPNSSRWPRPAGKASGRRPAHDVDRGHPASVLHRPAGPATPGQPADRRRLPRRAAPAAGLRPAAHRHRARKPGLERPHAETVSAFLNQVSTAGYSSHHWPRQLGDAVRTKLRTRSHA